MIRGNVKSQYVRKAITPRFYRIQNIDRNRQLFWNYTQMEITRELCKLSE